jgi:ferredoxin
MDSARNSRAPGSLKGAALARGKLNFMAYIITEPCIGTKDKSCVDVCPVDCIHGKDEDEMLYIDPEVCIDCGACVSACPVEAIFADSDVPEKWTNYTAINADYFKKV